MWISYTRFLVIIRAIFLSAVANWLAAHVHRYNACCNMHIMLWCTIGMSGMIYDQNSKVPFLCLPKEAIATSVYIAMLLTGTIEGFKYLTHLCNCMTKGSYYSFHANYVLYMHTYCMLQTHG